MDRHRAIGRIAAFVIPALLATQAVGAEAPRLVEIRPGLVVEDEAEGWSAVVVKSVSRLASGDLGTLPGWSSRSASLFRTVILADVRAVKAGGFVLDRVGIGLCVPVEGRGDVAVRSGALDRARVDLPTLDWSVLIAAEHELHKGRLVAATPTFAIYRTPSVLIVGGRHREVFLYYALLVDPGTGGLRAAVWPMAREPDERSAPKCLVQLGPPPSFDCPLDVRASRIAGLVPVSWSFAMRSLPPGTPRDLPGPVASLLAADGDGDAEAIERALSDLLGPEAITADDR